MRDWSFYLLWAWIALGWIGQRIQAVEAITNKQLEAA